MDTCANNAWCLWYLRLNQQKDDKSKTIVGYKILHVAKLESYNSSDRFTNVASYLLIFLNATIDLYNIKHIKGSSFCPSITPEFPPLRAYQRTHRCPIGLVSFHSSLSSLLTSFLCFGAAASKGPMTYAFTHRGNFSSSSFSFNADRTKCQDL